MKNRPLDGPPLLLFLLLLLRLPLLLLFLHGDEPCRIHGANLNVDFILSYRRFVRLFCPRLPFHRLATPSSLFLHPLCSFSSSSRRDGARSHRAWLSPWAMFSVRNQTPVSNRGGQPRERNTRENVIKRIVPIFITPVFRYNRGKLFGSMISRVRDRFVVRNRRDRSASLSKDKRAI